MLFSLYIIFPVRINLFTLTALSSRLFLFLFLAKIAITAIIVKKTSPPDTPATIELVFEPSSELPPGLFWVKPGFLLRKNIISFN